MKTSVHFILSLFAAATVLAGDPFQGKDVSQATLADGVRLSTRIVQDVYLMPEQITKLIFPKPVDEVSVNTQIVNIGRNPADSKECYLLLSPKVAKGDVDMHIVMEGKTYICPAMAGRISDLSRAKGWEETSPLSRLTSRQREILQLIAESKNTKEIASLLNLSPKTVEFHRAELMDRLNIHDVPGLVRFAIQAGLVQA